MREAIRLGAWGMVVVWGVGAAWASDAEQADRLVGRAVAAEASGDRVERDALLGLALKRVPDHAGARGMIGQVFEGSKWTRVEDVAGADRAEYKARRGKALETAASQAELAAWCEANGFSAEAEAHWSAVAKLARAGSENANSAWKRLGYRRHNGAWRTEREMADEVAQTAANKVWTAKFWRIRDQMRDPHQRLKAETALHEVTDPRAVPAICAVFGSKTEADQKIAVRLLGQILTPASSRALVGLTAYGTGPEVRRAAGETLLGRDSRDYVGALIDLLDEPIRSKLVEGQTPFEAARLIMEKPGVRVERSYWAEAPSYVPNSSFFGQIWIDEDGLPSAASGRFLQDHHGSPTAQSWGALKQNIAQFRAQWLQSLASAKLTARLKAEADLEDVEIRNAPGKTLAKWRVLPILRLSTGKDFGSARRPWKTWWLDQKGYTMPEPTTVVRQESALFSAPSVPVYSCFAAGTTVRTTEGLRPIETLERGDKVLAADPQSHALLFRPILEVFHNPPGATLKLEVDGETIVATGYHRFQRVGGDWAMARELRAGDKIRTVSGMATVSKIEPGQVQPVFNLDVAGANSFFVGRHAALVHDNDLPEADAAP